MSSVSGPGRSPGEGNGNPLQYSCLGNPMDRGAWSAAVHGVSQSQTWLSDQQEIFFIMNRIYLYSFKESKGTKSFFFFLNLQHRINGQWLIFFSVYFLFFGCSTWHVGYQFPDHESEPSTLHWTHGLLGTGPSGKSLFFFLFFLNECRDTE